jgi:pimeloyl-ACP methyl ester carboxylesterase
MIISKTPYRISFFGGGTDYPSWYRKNGGRVISKLASIKPNLVEKLIYVSASSFYDNPDISSNIVTDKEVQDFITTNYPTISKGQLLDFKYPENYPSWEGKYEELLNYKGFARALISTRKNIVTLDDIHLEINDREIPVYTIWGVHDKVVLYDSFKEKLDSILPNRKEVFIDDAAHLPHMENSIEFERYFKIFIDEIIK